MISSFACLYSTGLARCCQDLAYFASIGTTDYLYFSKVPELWHHRRRLRSFAPSLVCPPESRVTITHRPSCFSTVPGWVLLLRITLSPCFHCFMWSEWDSNPRPQRLKVNCSTRLCDRTKQSPFIFKRLSPHCLPLGVEPQCD